MNRGGTAGNGKIIPFYTLEDVRGAEEKINELYALGYRGVCVDPEKLKIPVDGKRLAPVFSAAAESGLPVSVRCGVSHFAEYVYFSPARLCDAADAFPKTTFIFSHLGGCRDYAEAAEALARKNVYFDTSSAAFCAAPSFLKKLVDGCGAEKILFASDMPW